MVAFKNTVICMNDNHSYYLKEQPENKTSTK